MNKTYVKIAGYGAFALFSFLVCLYLTFPADAVGDRVAQEVKRATQGKVMLSFGSASLAPLLGVSLSDVRVHWDRGGEPVKMRFDRMRAHVNTLPLLWLSLTASVELQIGDGRIWASVRRSGATYDVDAKIDALSLASPPILPQLAGMPLGGKVSGTIEGTLATLANGQGIAPKNSKAKLALSWTAGELGAGKIAGFSVPKTRLGNVSMGMSVGGGRLQLTDWQQNGTTDVNLSLAGSSVLQPQVARSRLDACVQFKAEDAFLKSNPKVQSALELAGVRFKKGKKGFLHVPLGNTLGSPKVRNGLCPSARKS